MSFHHATTLTGYARTAVDLRIAMADALRSEVFRNYIREPLTAVVDEVGGDHAGADRLVDAVARAANAAWRAGESFVLAPAMTAIVAAAAEALDLTGDLLTADVAPCDAGILFLPEPIYRRYTNGSVRAVGAITWTATTTPLTGKRSWLICSYRPLNDPNDVDAAKTRTELAAAHPIYRNGLGPYLLNDLGFLPIARPVPAPDTPQADEQDVDWSSTPEGRYFITDDGSRTDVLAALAYAFLRIQAQPITVASKTPADRPARRRAARASIVHETRVVMLRRTSPAADPGDGEVKWHYRVRFFVRGHWRHLMDKQGQPYRVRVQAHIKGPDCAPLLLGEKVAVLAR